MPHSAFGPLCALIVTLTLAAPVCASSADAIPEAPPALQQAILQQMETWGVPGVAVARIDNGSVSWVSGFGQVGPDRPVTTDTVFNVASLTKPLFATLVMHLVEEGVFTLDEPLADYWVDPDLADDARHRLITARLALSHQTGLPNWRGDNPLAFRFDPGSAHEYSGEGYEYVRRALERAAERPLTELMDKYVFEKADMHTTYLGWQDSFPNQPAPGYNETGRALDTEQLEQRQPNAAANTFTTVVDYARFAAWVAGGADLPPALFEEMMRPQAQHENPAEYFSIGWRITRLPGQIVMSHDGREEGVRTQVHIWPATGDGLVILTNSSNGELLIRPVTGMALEAGDALLGQIDRDTWHYVQSIPPEMQQGMLGFIARSPSFTSKLLHAVQGGVINGMDDALGGQVAERIDPFVLAFFRGEIGSEQVETLFGLLCREDKGLMVIRQQFDLEWLREWALALGQAGS